MTRDEYREKCIDAIDEAIANNEHLSSRRHKARRVLDSLHGIARVVPAEATEEMKYGAYDIEQGSTLDEIWRNMSANGDLTNPPEGKP